MADENIVRSYRSNGPARRAPDPVGPHDSVRDAAGWDEETQSDPLAELARLIGQSDPFADLGRPTGRSRAAPAAAPPRADPAPPSDWRATAAALAREALRSPASSDQQPEAADPHLEKIHSAIADINSYRAGPSDRFAQPQYPADMDQPEPAERYGEQTYFGDQEEASAHRYEQPGEEPSYFFGRERTTDERFYGDSPLARRGNGLVTAAVLIGCAMLGTVGAYGYRTYYSGARSTDAPIIAADPTPNKVVRASAADDPQSGKAGLVADASAGEQVVTHQEEPVTLPNPTTPPRLSLAPPFASQTPASSKPSSGAATPGAGAAKDPSEPKKVRTVAIRPDNPDAVARPLTSPSTSAPAPGQPATAATRTPTKPRNGAAPLPLEPQGEPGEPDRTASTGPRLASASPSQGSYVQLSSQRSEADAQASFRSMQTKFPQQLGDRELLVRRADLGPKGIYYRAMVGPFGSSAEADQFCSNLKAAGGQCLVQKN